MNKREFLSVAGAVIMTGCSTVDFASHKPILLTNVPVRIMSMNVEQRSLEILKSVSINPSTDEETSAFQATWTDRTVFESTEELDSFKGVKGPVITDFHGLRTADAEALSAGKPFVARVAIILPDLATAEGVKEGHRKVVSWFTPDDGQAPKAGMIDVNGKAVRVAMRDRNERIFRKTSVTAEDVSNGHWGATIDGHFAGGRIVIERMALVPKDDPVKVDDPKLPRVLVVGDSISMNYHEAARKQLAGIANYYRIDGNSGSTADAVKNMDMWLGDFEKPGGHWDVIQFNSGLHDLKTKVLGGPPAVSIDDYKKNLHREIALLKRTNAKLIWCSTTPVQNDSGHAGYAFRSKGGEKEFNQAADDVMKHYPDIQINDLSRVVNESELFDKWRQAKDVHFYRPEEQAALGKAVAEAVKKALSAGKP